MSRRAQLARVRREAEKVFRILEQVPAIDRQREVPLTEYRRRQQVLWQALDAAGFDVGVVFSDEHYRGDVPYLGGNTNISIEQVAGAIGPAGFHIIAGLEGGYIAEQLAPRSGSRVHKVEMLQLADEKYPITAERLEDVLNEAAGKAVRRVALLTPGQVLPASLKEYLVRLYGLENVVDAQPIYYRLKYEKSDIEMALIEDACTIADAMMRAMLAVIRPGMLETEVAAWGYFVASQLGAEGHGFSVMVGANEANRTLIGKALNREIREGDYVHLGVAPTRDGLNACVRRSIIAVDHPSKVTPEQRYWFNLVEEAYQVGYDWFAKVARENLPAKLQEQALVDYFASRSQDVSRRIGKPIQLERFKPYTGTHNSGYTECQEFYGAITLESEQPLGQQIVTMLDVALRGFGNHWHDVQIPGFDFVVVENTLGKFGPEVRHLNHLPVQVQALVGQAE